MLQEDYIKLFKSATTIENPYNSTGEVLDWLRKRSEQVEVKINRVDFKELNQWEFNEKTGNLRHSSGKFFSIDGIRVQTNWGGVNDWTQPIINQPEIGFLGMLAKEFNGVLYFLIQAKIEPGNIRQVQLSPTLQATKSNYSRVHQGKSPHYLEYFLVKDKYHVLLDQLQSEQGARFLRKRNRNIIIRVEEEIPVYPDFCWLTLGQITQLMRYDNTVNMDTRTVLSGITFVGLGMESNIAKSFKFNHNTFQDAMLKSAFQDQRTEYSFEKLISWLTQQKVQYNLNVKEIPLKELKNWVITKRSIYHELKQYFKVIAVDVEIANREVRRWSQPLIQPAQEGICAFVIKKIHGAYHFAVQAKLECGNFDILELAPTVQCLTGNYKASYEKVPFLKTVAEASSDQILFDTYQSEEGGRFFREQNRNLIVELDEHEELTLPSNFIWMSLYQLKVFIQFNNFLNIQARSLISMIDFTNGR